MLGFPTTRFTTGVLTGLVVALPLALSVSWVGAMAASGISGRQMSVETAAAAATENAVNRAAKSSRLPLNGTAGRQEPATVWTVSKASTSVVTKGEREAVRPRSNGATPRGCLSAIGGLNTGIATEETTVCVADISTIN